MDDIYCLGIDPGQEGAFVLLNNTGVLLHLKMPVIRLKNNSKYTVHYDIPHIVSFITKIKRKYASTHVFIEQIHAASGQGVSSMFSMGFGYGLLCGIINALSLPITHVKPDTWKKELMPGMPKDKLASCVIVGRLFPGALPILKTPRGKPDHNIADAILIAEWGRRQSL